jgi:hypothetical protein
MRRNSILHWTMAAIVLLGTVSIAPAQSTTTAPPQTPGPAPAPAPAPEPQNVTVYGFAMTDFGYDFKTNDPNWFDVNRPSKLPAFFGEFGRNGKTFAGVRQTKLGVKASQQTPLGELKAQVEFDFFGVGVDAGQTTIRPRYFYGEVGAFGAGQTVSPFMDLDVFPNILEYWGPNGMVFFRNVQVRWMPLRGDTRLTLAVERPGSTQDPGVLVNRIEIQNVRARYPYPDFSGEFRVGRNGTYGKVSGIVRKTVLDDSLNDRFNLDDSVIGWGVDLSSNIKFWKDVLRLQYVWGEGIENYMNDAPVDIAAVPNFGDPTKPIKGDALPLKSLVAYLDHNWSSKWSTAIGYSQLVIDNTVLQTADAFHRGQYASVNLLHTPVENFMYGGEFQWGRRKNARDGFGANDYRLQFGFKFSFSALIPGGVK